MRETGLDPLHSSTDFYEMNLPADVFRLKPFLRKKRMQGYDTGKSTGAFLFSQNAEKEGFFSGFLAASILYCFLLYLEYPGYGNRLNSTQAVLEVLEREGIRTGQPRKDFRRSSERSLKMSCMNFRGQRELDS